MHPVRIVDALWEAAAEVVEPPQLAIIIVSEPDGLLAFRHNCAAGLPALSAALREMADKLDRGEAQNLLTLVKP